MRMIALVLAAFALSPASADGAVRRCGYIAFTPNSDDIAHGIRAEGVSCRTARRFIRAVDGHAPRRFRGYRCTRKELDTPLTQWRYRCTDGGKLIRWVKS